ncbi:MAG: 3',5'-cyclic-nucleotide phosphodiesterase [Gammaproteobacteria bacterium]
MKREIKLGVLVLTVTAGGAAAHGFDVLTLGARGGIQDGNLSAFMIHPSGDPRAVTCDAGAIVAGLIRADEEGTLDGIKVPSDSDYSRVGYVLNSVIRGYLISHAHLDHFGGVVVTSPDDSAKPIYALESVLAAIENTYFNWVAWPNFGDAGPEPRLSKYTYTVLEPGTPRELTNTAMSVTAFPLAHDATESTGFLIESREDAILCLGDTGPDSVEGTDNLDQVWRAVSNRAASGDLKAVIIESSYTSDQPDEFLFGHLTPRHLLEELGKLARYAGGEDAIAGLPVVISHIKYSLKSGQTPQEKIQAELEDGNTLGVRFIIPEQGARWTFDDWK